MNKKYYVIIYIIVLGYIFYMYYLYIFSPFYRISSFSEPRIAVYLQDNETEIDPILLRYFFNGIMSFLCCTIGLLVLLLRMLSNRIESPFILPLGELYLIMINIYTAFKHELVLHWISSMAVEDRDKIVYWVFFLFIFATYFIYKYFICKKSTRIEVLSLPLNIIGIILYILGIYTLWKLS